MTAEQGDLPPPAATEGVFTEPDPTDEVARSPAESIDAQMPSLLRQPWFAGALSGAIVAMVIVLLTGRADPPAPEVQGAVAEPGASVEAVTTIAQADWGWMGISTDGVDGPGVQVSVVEAESPAAVAGVLEGDVIVEFDGADIDTPDELTAIVRNAGAGHEARLDIIRNGAPVALTITLGERAVDR
jgi:S1-C subfamily serine protease